MTTSKTPARDSVSENLSPFFAFVYNDDDAGGEGGSSNIVKSVDPLTSDRTYTLVYNKMHAGGVDVFCKKVITRNGQERLIPITAQYLGLPTVHPRETDAGKVVNAEETGPPVPTVFRNNFAKVAISMFNKVKIYQEPTNVIQFEPISKDSDVIQRIALDCRHIGKLIHIHATNTSSSRTFVYPIYGRPFQVAEQSPARLLKETMAHLYQPPQK